ncbi:MAG: ABC transporter substrate-binding protein [Candidatus Zixiibacteriota bacterium]
MIKKVLPPILIVLIALGLALAIVRFVLPRLGKPEEITLNYWGLWEPESIMGEVLADWEKEHPNIKISYTQHSPKEYRERLQSALAKEDGPDIFRFHNTWLPMLKNELEPVPATVMDATTFEQTFYPIAASSLRSGTNYLGIPLEIDTLALFYNQDIFTAAGASPPRTWDELRQLASQLTLRNENGRIQRAGVALGTTGNIWHWSDILGLMMLQNGADLTNPTGSLAEDALTFYTIFAKTDRVWDETLPVSILAFATGKTAMFFGFSWDVFEIKNINPNLNFKVVPVPQLPGTDIAWASFWVEGVNRRSKNKEAAWEFLKFLSSKEVMQKLYQAESKIRLFGEPYSRVEMASMLQADPMVAPFINQASKAQTWYLCSRTFDNGINERMIKYFEDAVNAVNAGETPEEALATAASGVAQVLSQYGLASYTTR